MTFQLGFNIVMNLFQNILTSFQDVFVFLTVPFNQMGNSLDTWLSDILSNVLSGLGFGEYSLIMLMFGVAIPIFIVYSLVKWLIR